MSETLRTDAKGADPAYLETLSRIERRVLWLATSVVHHAERVRVNPPG
jgi:pyruvate dehydrogenase E1 component